MVFLHYVGLQCAFNKEIRYTSSWALSALYYYIFVGLHQNSKCYNLEVSLMVNSIVIIIIYKQHY